MCVGKCFPIIFIRKKKNVFFLRLGEFYFEGLKVSVCTDVSVQVVALGSINVQRYVENLANQSNNNKKHVEYFIFWDNPNISSRVV